MKDGAAQKAPVKGYGRGGASFGSVGGRERPGEIDKQASELPLHPRIIAVRVPNRLYRVQKVPIGCVYNFGKSSAHAFPTSHRSGSRRFDSRAIEVQCPRQRSGPNYANNNPQKSRFPHLPCRKLDVKVYFPEMKYAWTTDASDRAFPRKGSDNTLSLMNVHARQVKESRVRWSRSS